MSCIVQAQEIQAYVSHRHTFEHDFHETKKWRHFGWDTFIGNGVFFVYMVPEEHEGHGEEHASANGEAHAEGHPKGHVAELLLLRGLK